MSAKAPQRQLTQRVMSMLYYDLLAISEEIDRADPYDRETLRALLALIDELRIPNHIVVQAAQVDKRVFDLWRSNETRGHLLYIPKRRRTVTARIVTKLKSVLRHVIDSLPKDGKPSFKVPRRLSPEGLEAVLQRRKQLQAMRNQRHSVRKKKAREQAILAAAKAAHNLEKPACPTTNSGPPTTSPATTKSAPTTSSSSGASAISAAGKTGSKSTAETPKSARHPTGASGRLKS